MWATALLQLCWLTCMDGDKVLHESAGDKFGASARPLASPKTPKPVCSGVGEQAWNGASHVKPEPGEGRSDRHGEGSPGSPRYTGPSGEPRSLGMPDSEEIASDPAIEFRWPRRAVRKGS